MNDLKLNARGKTAIVTGGAKGIGRQGVEAFLRSGANVLIADIDTKTAKATAQEITSIGPRIEIVETDVTNPESVQNMVSHAVDTFGRIDILFNNAGICVNESAQEMSIESWKKVIDINLTGIFLVAQKVGGVMIAQKGGVIINTASMSAHIVNQPQPQCSYNASKAGVIQLTKSLAVEWAAYGVRVNSISPGYVATEMTLKAPEEWKAHWTSHGVYDRMGNPEELESVLLYLASGASSFTTGADIVIDGAFSCI